MNRFTITCLCIGIISIVHSQSCDQIIRSVDEFTDIITISSPRDGLIGSTKYDRPAYIFKKIIGSNVSYHLALRSYAAEYKPLEKGVFVLFADGSKFMDLNTIIEVERHKRGNEYFAIVPIPPSDLQSFSSKQISKFRLFAFEGEIDDEDSKIIMEYAKCLKAAK